MSEGVSADPIGALTEGEKNHEPTFIDRNRQEGVDAIFDAE